MAWISSYLSTRARSFLYAGSGVLRLVREEKNAQIHLLATLVVVVSGYWLNLSAVEWALIVLAIVAVWAAEAMNSAIERIADVVSPGQHPMIGAAKDLAAGGVLVVALGAVVVGMIVLFSHLPR